ncbi:transposase [Roseateles sp.]|uniref:transposase n=1 Tax=Roseateles sp. TaxID=1971397 RepID=UPI0039EB440B
MQSLNSGSAGAIQRTDITPWQDLDAGYRPGLIAEVRAMPTVQSLPAEGREYLRQAAEAPSRRVRSTVKSMSGGYPSTKMGVSISFESRTLELPAVRVLEHDEAVIAFFDQAPPLTVRYKRGNRTRSYLQRPDFLVVRDDVVVLIECKPMAQIAVRNARDPDFYMQRGGRWFCPALQEAARPLGLQHEVWTEEAFSPISLRNLRMLGDYLSSHNSTLAGYDVALVALQRYLSAEARAQVDQVLDVLAEEVCVEHLYAAIAQGDVAFDPASAPLAEPHRCFLYRDQRTLRAFELSDRSRTPVAGRVAVPIVEVGSGMSIEWDGHIWRCLQAGHTMVSLSRADRHEAIPRAVFDDLVRTGVVKPLSTQAAQSSDAAVFERIAKAPEAALRSANDRHKRIERYLVPGAKAPTCRTVRRYVAQYRQAQVAHGVGFVGLIPGFARSGNRKPRLQKAVLEIVQRNVDAHYLKSENKHALSVYGLIADDCKAARLPVPSYSWFCRFLSKLPAYRTALARGGRKGAYSLEPRALEGDGLDKMAPERPFEVVHVDHTLLDVETVSGETSEPLGRCWLTVMIDHFSRRVLAFHLTFDPPSYRSVLMVMRRCVQRHGRLPEVIVVDGGKEFHSTWFDVTAALYRVTVLRRPIAKARFGSQGERMFGTCNTNLVHFLSGNTQLRRNVRELTAEVDPNRSAVWTLPMLHDALVRYFYEIYDTLEHRELLVTPRFAFERGMERHGTSPQRLVAFNELFHITTSAAPPKRTAKVQPDGVKIHYLYYGHPALQRHLGESVEVRYDPFDKSVAWAFVDGAWLRLRTRHDALLRGFTERDIDLATIEWRKRRSMVERQRLTQPVLIAFLKEILETEVLLLERKRAAEERRLRQPEADMYDVVDADEAPPGRQASDSQPPDARPAGRQTIAAIDGELENLEVTL